MTTASTNSQRVSVGAERVPPQDLDAEMALLGSMMMSRDAIAEVIPIIGREDSEWFYLPAHRKLFEVLLDIYDNPRKAVDIIVVSDELRRRELFDFIGGHDYMVRLAESFAEWANAEYYAEIVRDKGLLRDLIRSSREIADEAYSGIDETRIILDVAEQKIFKVAERRLTSQSCRIGHAVNVLVKQLESGSEGLHTGVTTGFRKLDDLTGGFQHGDLIVVAARPSMGKTALGLSMAHYMSVHDHRPTVFISMEMSTAQVAQRLVCAHKNIDSHRLRRRNLSEREKRDLVEAQADFDQAPLFVDDSAGLSILGLRSIARRMKQKHDIQVIFVDYLQLMHSPRAENRQVEISTISRGLKSLARELNIPVVAMAQLNRMSEGRNDKRPIMSDLRESGAIEQDADVVLLLHREEYYDFKNEKPELQGKAELIIAKQRNGPTDIVELHFNKQSTSFSNPSYELDRPERADDVVPF